MSVMLRTDVTAVKLYENYVLAGIGSWVNVFDRKSFKLLQKIHALRGQKIYGLVPTEKNKILVVGGKQFTIINTSNVEDYVKCFEAVVCDDWLHSGIWLANEHIALLTAHNVVQVWDATNQSLVSNHISKENSILYSGLLLPIDVDILVFSGTVFSEVLIHRCGSDRILHSLKGHKGVIFSVTCNPQKGIIVTTSDDRSVRIWQLYNTSSFLPNSIEYWENVNITCRHELYGHLARVMRNCINNDFVISVGEDSFVCFWDFNGKLLRKISTPQNACIWSLDADEKDLVTGGSDSSVIVHPLSMVLEYGTCVVIDVEIANAKKLVFTARRNIVIMTETNDLVYYNATDKLTSKLKLQHESTYKSLTISSCRQIIAVIDMFGKLDVFIETCKGLATINRIIDTKLQIGKILSMQLVGNRHLVLCSDIGAIIVLASKGNTTEIIAEYFLPPCKERWLTTAAICLSRNMLVVGDRCGSLHVYIPGQKTPFKTFKNIYVRYGPTSIRIRNNEVVTTGRDGTVKYFHIDNNCVVKLMFSRSLEFQWVESFIDKDEHYICGFQERVFVVYDVRNNSKLFEVPCGGGRRSWDVLRCITKVENDYKEQIKFVYLKNSNIIVETFDVSKVASRNIVNGTHSKEINCLKAYKCGLDLETSFVISGGEDTSLRVLRIDSNNDFRDEIIFKQLSSIRTLNITFIEDNKVLVVSAGGRAQICIKLLQFGKVEDKIEVVTEELCDYLINGTDKERKVNQNWRNSAIDFDPETRIMDVDVIRRDGGNTIIVAGCSDAYVRIFDFQYDGNNSAIKLEQEIKYHETCVLKTHSFTLGHKTLLITCTTRGIATFWDVTDTKELDALQFKPFTSFLLHKSGINCLACKVISDKAILIATGGDDNEINLNLIDINEDLESTLKNNWSSNKLHCSQVTGLAFVEDFIVSTSIDQRVTLLRFQVDEEIKCEFISQVYSDVADIQGLDILKHDSESITVCVFGKGIEVISMPKRCH